MNRPAENTAATDDVPEQYVINLCASTTPMALVQPKEEALKRFTFFVSRRREDGRERFRLHMGYFTAPEEAEEWLPVVRELYPAAWVGEAPGKKLRAKAAAESVARAAQAAALAPVPAPPIAAPIPAPVPSAPAAAVSAIAPAAKVAARPAPAPPAPVQAPEPKRPLDTLSLSNVSDVMAELDEKPAPTLYVPPPMVLPEHIPTVQAAAGAPPIVPTLKAVPAPTPMPTPAPAPVAKAPPPLPAPPVAASVTPPAPRPPMPKPPAAPPQVAAPSKPQVAAPPPAAPAPPPAMIAAPAPASAAPAAPNLSDSQVLRVLEDRREGASGAGEPQSAVEREADAAIPVLRPDDTRTMRALRTEVQKNAAVQFAVQLDWSVSPIDISKVPPLAIFGAYTLYSVESSRDGRKWYGLRLGFFTDALSAKQVAYYVRSDFVSVAVVPVTAEEKDRAMEGAHSPNDIGKSRNEGKAAEEFKLFDLEEPPAAKPVAAPAPKPAAPANGASSTARTRGRGKPAPKRKAGNIEEQLEQTLEILGASDLEIDRGKGELLNDTGVRHLSVKIDKRTSTFSKLLDKLSDRMGNR